MCCFSFGSPVSASTGSKQVFKEVEKWIWIYCSRSNRIVCGFVFKELEGTKLFETDRLSAPPIDSDELKMDV